MKRCEPLYIIAKPTQAIYSANNIKDKSRKSAFYGWQLFPRTAALLATACVMPDFCCRVQSRGLLSAKPRREISQNKIYTDVNLGLYLVVLPYKHDLLFSNVCGLNGPFATNDHMVQNPPCWRASSLLFPHWDIKTKASQA